LAAISKTIFGLTNNHKTNGNALNPIDRMTKKYKYAAGTYFSSMNCNIFPPINI
jgi:hypothetical protein